MRFPCCYSEPPWTLRNSAVTKSDATAWLCWTWMILGYNIKDLSQLTRSRQLNWITGQFCYNSLLAIVPLNACPGYKLAIRVLSEALVLCILIPPYVCFHFLLFQLPTDNHGLKILHGIL